MVGRAGRAGIDDSGKSTSRRREEEEEEKITSLFSSSVKLRSNGFKRLLVASKICISVVDW